MKSKKTGFKKKIIIAVSGVVAATALGLGIYQSDASKAEPSLSFEEVEKLVADQYPGTITELELEKEFNRAVYEVEVESDGKKYDLKMDGDTGEIVKLKEKKVTITEKESDKATEDKGENVTSKHNAAANEADSEQKETKKQDTKETVIDANEAVNIARKEFAGTVTNFELDEDDGRLVYEIEIESRKEEAEIEIDAYTGEVLVVEIDD